MSDYKLVPVEATPEMEQAAEKYWNERRFKSFSADPRTWQGAYAAMLAAAPAVQGEPVGEVRLELGAPSVVYGELYSEAAPHLVPGTLLYAAPQPAPDVSGLVEALTELCDEIDKHEIHAAISKTSISWFKRKARAALAPYRKGGEA